MSKRVAIVTGSASGIGAATAIGPERYATQEKFWLQTSPLKRVGVPEDVAEAVLWFVEGAGTITGQVLSIDSGFTLGALPPHAR
jgi:pteridine reductase